MSDSASEKRIWLAIPQTSKEVAKADAGRLPDGRRAIEYSREDGLWFAHPGADMEKITKWLPDQTIRSSGSGDAEIELRDELTAAGMVVKGKLELDGKSHRLPVVQGKNGNKDGVYKVSVINGKAKGWYINYQTSLNDKDITYWKASESPDKVDPIAKVHIRANARQQRDNAERAQAELYIRSTASAKTLYDQLPPADPAHAYLLRKGVIAISEMRQTRNGALVIPFENVNGEFRTLQYIPPDGAKYLYKNAPKAGHFRTVGGELKNGEPILYAEGYATACSLYMVTGRPVVMTIDAGNMENVSKLLKVRYPDSPHLFMADVDHSKKINKGVLSANRAAAATGGLVLLPDLTAAEIQQGFTDFNDLHLSRGAEQLRETLLPDIVHALEQLNYKDASMATPDDVQSASDNIPAISPDALPDATTVRRQGAAQEKTDMILKLRDDGLTPAQIAKELSIGQTSVYRILKAQQSEAEASSAIPEPAASSATPEPAASSATPEPAASSATPEPAASSATPEPAAPSATSEPAASSAAPEPVASTVAPEPTAATTAGVNSLLAASPAAQGEKITLYHGSPATFSAIDPDKIGLGENFMGHGFYTDDSVTGVHYAMDEINHRDFHVYELEIPSRSVILDRWDSSSLTDELRERIREAGKKVDQQLTEQGLTSRLGIGDSLAGCEKIDEPFFKYADSPEGARILKEAGIDALKDNSYIAIFNTDLIENVRLHSAQGAPRNEMAQYVENALGSSVQDSSRLTSILQDNPDYSIYYHAIRLELLKLAKTQDKQHEAERLIGLLRHTLVETVDNSPDRKNAITPLNRVYAEAVRSLDLNHDDSAKTLAHLIDTAVMKMNPDKKPAIEAVRPEPVISQPVVSAQVMPAPEAPQNSAVTAGMATGSEPAVMASMPNETEVEPHPAPQVAPVSMEKPEATRDVTPADPVDLSADFSDINSRLRTLKDGASSLDTETLAIRLGALVNERIGLTEMWAQNNNSDDQMAPSEDTEALEADLRAELDRRPEVTPPPLTTASVEENGILVEARRVAPQPEDTPAEHAPRTDQDKLLSRISHEDHPDGKSVIYRLDSEPAFIDRGNRLVMAEGASAHEEKVLAALLTAAKFYYGKIELTGSDEFKAFAISVIVNNGLQVSMKNPSQQLALEEARRAAGQPVATPDAVRGDPVAPVTASAPTAASTAPPVSPATAAPAMADAPVFADIAPAQAPDSSVTVNPEKPAIRPDIHTPAEKAREPVTGKVTACGQAPFRFEKGGDESTFITLRTREGAQTFWGKELAGLMRETRLREGQMVTLQWMGKQPVTVNKPVKDTQGNFTGHYEPIHTKRNQWALTSARGNRVQTGGDEMLKLSAFSANRYTQVQHALVSQLGISIDAPPKPADGLYWIRPDGQGSVSAGDALSAQRPPHNENAGKPVMTAWGADGQPDLYLVQGDGHYLQGIVRQNESYQHVLVSLPDSKEAPRMVINLLTPDGAQPIGSGNGINRSDGKPVPREHVVFRVTGDEKQRIAKLHEPASIPPALHARLGYDERYKAETVYPKEQPAAAPQAAPVTPPRPAQ